MNPHVYTDTRSLVLPVCQFQHSRLPYLLVSICILCIYMREMGLEPTRLYKHKILSLACLPIPALPLTCRFSQTTSESIANVFLFVKSFFHFFRRLYKHKILSLACLPIPALPLTCRFSQTTSESIANVFLFVKSFFHFFRRLNFPLQIYFLSVCHLPDK